MLKILVISLGKLKNLKLHDGAILVTADALGFYASIPHEDGLDALSEKLETFQDKKIAKEDLLKMAKFVLNNIFFEFTSKAKQQISGTVIGTKFAFSQAYIFMDKIEKDKK